MTGRILVRLGNFLCSKRDNPIVRIINKAIRILYFKIENENYDIRTNGEGRVLKIIAGLGYKVYFDVGANHGEWSEEVLKINPQAVVYAFEASPLTFTFLKSKLGRESRVHVNNVGLYSSEGVMNFYQGVDDTQSSLVNSQKQENSKVISVNVTTLDKFVKDHGLTEIDFLKIDTEGADYEILKGGMDIIKSGVKVIQFEYGFVSVNTRNLLEDYYKLLESQYVIGKIYPSSVEFTPYVRSMENFIGPNFLAVRKDITEVIAKLR